MSNMVALLPPSGNSSPSRPHCLIVEDQVLVALSIEAYLEETGFEIEGPIRSGSEALFWLRAHTPQAVILDYGLADGSCTALARELRRRDIPFLVYSGYRLGSDLPLELHGVPWIEKPCRREELMTALQTILVGHVRASIGFA
ncbi:response regulator [Microvirga pudoricolor]|uniref:response regulator n=1 Tax=Microvirga pudoricolor TaxID=2778729 RepID=UPI00194F883B|nr:response regulator [Microvirga pudoricolor]MBM6596398.1 response regulator [Microvirga pudoricolor]